MLKHFRKLDSVADVRLVLFEIKQATLTVIWPAKATDKELTFLLKEFEDFFNDFFIKLSEDCLSLFSSLFEESAREELHKFAGLVLSKLAPSLQSHLEHIEREGKEIGISHIVHLYQISNAFGSRFEAFFYSSKVTIGPDHYGKAIFEPFVPYQKRYEAFEKKFLDFKLRFEVFDCKNLLNFISIAETVRSRFLLFTYGLVKLDFEGLLDDFLGSAIDKATEVVKISPDYQDFAASIENLQAAIIFFKKLETFWKSLSNLTSESSPSSASCMSSAAVLKTLRRDFHIMESERVCLAITKAKALLILWQSKSLQTLLAPVNSALNGVEKLDFWTREDSGDMQFSLSPLSYITTIGEFVYTLPQAFEPYSQEEFLSHSLKSLPFIDDEMVLMDGSVEGELMYEPIHIWIISSVRLIESKVVDVVLMIDNLSKAGLRQLQADFNYFHNVMLAIQMEPQERFRNLLDAMKLDDDALKIEMTSSETVHDLNALKAVAKMRAVM